jgi:hypothetical protein
MAIDRRNAPEGVEHALRPLVDEVLPSLVLALV